MRSDSSQYIFLKYGFLGVALLCMLFSVISWVSPETMTINGKQGQQDIALTLIFGLIGVLALLFFLLVKDKFAMVELSAQTIEIMHRGEERSISWMDVEKIALIPAVAPPLYRLKIRGDEDILWFNTTTSGYTNLMGFVSDNSDMGMLIQKKKSELGI